MVIVKVVCEGTRPLLMERMSDEVLESLQKGTPPPPKRGTDLGKIAEEKIYRNPESGEFTMPADNFWACLVAGGSQVSFKGKKNLSNSSESILPGILNIREDYLPFTDGDGWKVDKRRGVLNSGKGSGVAVCIVRPRFDKWGFSATLDIDDSMIAADKIKELIKISGRFYGLGGHRKKGRFGRFQIVNWEVVAGDKKS